MATVLPFAGMRPPGKLAEQVAAPPYDVISSGEARQLAENNPLSFLHINKPEIDLPEDVDVHSDAVYEQGRQNMERFLAEGIFARDAHPAFYLYRQALEQDGQVLHAQTGIVGLVSADEYEKDIIRKHELTRPEKENDRVKHMQAVQAQTGPVFLTYRTEEKIERLVAEHCRASPEFDFTSDNVRHQLWPLTDKDLLNEISSLFATVPTLFIADGHHRSAAAVRYRDYCREQNTQHTGNEAYNFFMAVLFPHDQLNILGYHRVVRDLGGMDAQAFLDALAEHYEIKPNKTEAMPTTHGQFGLYLDGQWYRLTLKNPAALHSNTVSALDVSILQDTVFSPLLDIKDVRVDPRVDFIGGIRGQGALEQAVDSGEFAAAFACYPISVEQLMTISGQGELMPPKTTWFEPKLKSGLVIHYLA